MPGNLRAFIQTTYANDYGRAFGLDNTDIRYASNGALGNLDFVYGVTVNDIPTVQDVWNTTPVWRFPFITSNFALSPAASTMLESFGPGQTAGAGGYIFAHDLVYAELTGYGSLTPRAQTTLGDCCGPTISGVAPYWRVAVEPNWGDNSLMVGTFGMHANMLPGGMSGSGNGRHHRRRRQFAVSMDRRLSRDHRAGELHLRRISSSTARSRSVCPRTRATICAA